MNKLKILHATLKLHWGNAEKLLHDLVTHLDKNRYECEVLALKENGPVGTSR